MAGKNKMPPELLEHFKSKAEDKADKGGSAGDEKESDKEKRKEAVHKARVRLESKNRRRSNDEEKETGKASN